MVNGVGDDDNEFFYIENNNLKNNIPFDYETQKELSIRVKVTDHNNQSFEKKLVIDIINVNDISIEHEVSDSFCNENMGNGSIIITNIYNTSGLLEYNWYATNGGKVPSGQEKNKNLTNLSSGTYKLLLSDDNFVYTETFNINLIPQYDEFNICYVSSDNVDKTKNRIYLSNQGAYNVDMYEILRESNISNVYNVIGTIASTEDSFLDDTSNNLSQSYKYKVRAIDNCGNTTSNSVFHKTILLQSSIAVNGTVNLNWSNYEGTNFNTYDIYRSTNKEKFQIINSVSVSSNSFNDITANITDNNYEYYISIKTEGCLNGMLEKKSNNFTEIKSNYQNVESSLSLKDSILSVYPNPTDANLNIKLNFGIKFIKAELYNSIGQKVMESKDTSFSIKKLPSSTYFIKIYTSKGVRVKSFIKNKKAF